MSPASRDSSEGHKEVEGCNEAKESLGTRQYILVSDSRSIKGEHRRSENVR